MGALALGATVLFMADPCQIPVHTLFQVRLWVPRGAKLFGAFSEASPLQLSEEGQIESAAKKLREVPRPNFKVSGFPASHVSLPGQVESGGGRDGC